MFIVYCFNLFHSQTSSYTNIEGVSTAVGANYADADDDDDDDDDDMFTFSHAVIS